MNGNHGSEPNYEPNSLNGPVEDPTKKWHQQPVTGTIGRFKHSHPNDDFEQPRVLFRKVLNETDRTHLIDNIVGSLKNARRDVSYSYFYLFLYRFKRDN